MQRSSATDRSCFFQHHNPIHRKSQIHPVALYHIHCRTHFDAPRECGTRTTFYTSKNLCFDHMYLNLGNCIWNCLSLAIATHPIVDRHLCIPPKNDCSARMDQSIPGSTVWSPVGNQASIALIVLRWWVGRHGPRVKRHPKLSDRSFQTWRMLGQRRPARQCLDHGRGRAAEKGKTAPHSCFVFYGCEGIRWRWWFSYR